MVRWDATIKEFSYRWHDCIKNATATSTFVVRVQTLNECPIISYADTSSKLLNRAKTGRLEGERLTGWKVRPFYAHCPEREEEELVSFSLSLSLSLSCWREKVFWHCCQLVRFNCLNLTHKDNDDATEMPGFVKDKSTYVTKVCPAGPTSQLKWFRNEVYVKGLDSRLNLTFVSLPIFFICGARRSSTFLFLQHLPGRHRVCLPNSIEFHSN